MSHFCGLVILTPEYEGDVHDAVAPYDEQLVVDEYIVGEVSDFEKVSFLTHYNELNRADLSVEFYNANKARIEFKNIEEYKKEYPYSNWNDETKTYAYLLLKDNKQEFADFWIEKFPNEWADFDAMYAEYGEDWNGSYWRINPETNKWTKYSQYNPLSKWDWYKVNGRWSGAIKTTQGESVNECLLGEIDWTPTKDENQYSTNFAPFCLVINEDWYERGKMGWWCSITNELSYGEWRKKFFGLIKELPEDSKVYNVDFHI